MSSVSGKSERDPIEATEEALDAVRLELERESEEMRLEFGRIREETLLRLGSMTDQTLEIAHRAEAEIDLRLERDRKDCERRIAEWREGAEKALFSGNALDVFADSALKRLIPLSPEDVS